MHAQIRGTRIFFDVDGAEYAPGPDRMTRRPVLFLLHGGPGGDHASFKTTSAALRDVAQLVYVDHRGSGRSAPAPAHELTLENNVDDLDALRDDLGLERIALLGSSYGGMVALGYALRYPSRLSNLVLVCTAASFRFIEEARRHVDRHGTADQKRVCQALWEGSFQSLEQLREFYQVMGPMYSTTFKPQEFEASWNRSLRSIEALNQGFGGFLRSFDFTGQLHEIRCPTLVIGARHDWICAPRHSEEIARHIPRAHLKIFENSGHMVAADENEAYLAAIRGFLTYAPA